MPDASIQPGSGARSAQFVIIAGRGEFVGVGVGDTDLLIAVIRILFVANEREQGIFLTLGDLRFTEAADDLWDGVADRLDYLHAHPAYDELPAAAGKPVAERQKIFALHQDSSLGKKGPIWPGSPLVQSNPTEAVQTLRMRFLYESDEDSVRYQRFAPVPTPGRATDSWAIAQAVRQSRPAG